MDAAPHGKTLYDIVKSYKVSPPNLCHVRFYLACLVLALEEIHSLGYIHRDIKLDNVILQAESDGYPRLVDFGFVRSIRPILTACPKCGEQSDHISVFKTRFDNDNNNDNDDDDEEENTKGEEAEYTSIITQLSQLECCDCSCVHEDEDFIKTNICNEMHLYHNCAESIIHLSKLFIKKSRTTTIHHIQQDNLTSFKEAKGAGSQVYTRPKRSSSLVGTIDYLPPELHTPLYSRIDDDDDDKRIDCSVDIWSLGVLAYELLTGISPFSQRVISKQQTVTEEEDNEEEDSVVANRAKNVTLLDLSTLILQLHSKHDTKVEAEDAVDLVRMLLQPIPNQRPCVHQIMGHPFFKSHIDWKELQLRHITPPPVSSKEDLFDIKRQFECREEGVDVHTHSTRQPLKFGEDTFIGMSEQLYEARRAGGLIYAQGEYKDDPLELVDEFRL
jgi:serine/threonine protein kinase